LCDTGFFINDQEVCEPCSISPCQVGFYRKKCSSRQDAKCVPCTNFVPNGSLYSSSGQPYNTNHCDLRCENGFYPLIELASVNLSTMAPVAVCASCNNSKPNNSNYNGASDIVGLPFCPWECKDGYIQDGMDCRALEGNCSLGSCPLPKMITNVSVSLNNPCYEWQYAECNGSHVTCQPCLGVSTIFQGGAELRTYEACEVGWYRAPCVNRCVFPDAGNVRGQCVTCSNARTLHARYTSSGRPLSSNNCSWLCDNGYTKVSIQGREQCI